MKCPGNPDHEGIRIVLTSQAGTRSPHYAKAQCKQCGAWIKWLSEKETNALLANEGEMEEAGDKPIRRYHLLGEMLGDIVREIVREEIAKVNNGGSEDDNQNSNNHEGTGSSAAKSD